MAKPYTPDFPNETVPEGKIKLVVPQLKAYGVCPSDYAPSRAPVFYNPVMEFNRDLTVLAFQTYQRMAKRKIKICEPLTATGIRGIRFAAEIEGVKKVVSGDINQHSADLAAYNVALNNLQSRVLVKHKDANRLLSEYGAPKKRFDIIDIDPFGTPVPHLDASIQALRNSGLLATTATDMRPSAACTPKLACANTAANLCAPSIVKNLPSDFSRALLLPQPLNMTSAPMCCLAIAATTTSAFTPKSGTAPKKPTKP
jgi:tRNA G26 N,N-dimethylase Trm1